MATIKKNRKKFKVEKEYCALAGEDHVIKGMCKAVIKDSNGNLVAGVLLETDAKRLAASEDLYSALSDLVRYNTGDLAGVSLMEVIDKAKAALKRAE